MRSMALAGRYRAGPGTIIGAVVVAQGAPPHPPLMQGEPQQGLPPHGELQQGEPQHELHDSVTTQGSATTTVGC